jgi:prepilin-type N-terminal cleavage/methylation domain-containing protein
MKISNQSRVQSPESRVQRRRTVDCGLRTADCGLRTGNCESGFTMVEIAISLAVIGIALVAIIGVLPIGMNTQRDNREETIINQDATVLMEAIRGGARGMDDLTNYVYAITNYQTLYNPNPKPTVTFGWTNYPSFLTNGMNIIGLLSTSEFTDINGAPLANITGINYYSNHVVAYVHSLSGPAVEKPPQNNDIVVGDSFGYRILCVNAPVAMVTPPLWLSQPYNSGDSVSRILNGQVTYWQATTNTLATDFPGISSLWMRNLYPQELAANLHEVRLTFLWPQQPNGSVGPGRQTFRTMVAGQITQTNNNGQWLYFYQSQSFTNAP